MKTTNIRGWHIVVFYLLALGIALLFLSSCATVAKKNEQAYQRVITDSAMFRSIGQKFASLQKPCSNDTIIGETEVLILSDTAVLPGTTDTIIRPDTIRITTTRTNTVTNYVVDNRAINELSDSLQAVKLREAQQKGIILQVGIDKAEQEKRATSTEKRLKQLGWVLWGLVAVIAVLLFRQIVPSIRKVIGI